MKEEKCALVGNCHPKNGPYGWSACHKVAGVQLENDAPVSSDSIIQYAMDVTRGKKNELVKLVN